MKDLYLPLHDDTQHIPVIQVMESPSRYNKVRRGAGAGRRVKGTDDTGGDSHLIYRQEFS